MKEQLLKNEKENFITVFFFKDQIEFEAILGQPELRCLKKTLGLLGLKRLFYVSDMDPTIQNETSKRLTITQLSPD